MTLTKLAAQQAGDSRADWAAQQRCSPPTAKRLTKSRRRAHDRLGSMLRALSTRSKPCAHRSISARASDLLFRAAAQRFEHKDLPARRRPSRIRRPTNRRRFQGRQVQRPSNADAAREPTFRCAAPLATFSWLSLCRASIAPARRNRSLSLVLRALVALSSQHRARLQHTHR